MAFEFLKSFLPTRTKESRSWQAILSLGLTGPQWMAGNYEAYAREGYTWNSTVYACINKTTSALRGVKFGVYRQKGAGLVPVNKGPLSDLIKYPNPRQSFSSLVSEWAGSMEIAGNAYMEGVSAERNQELLTKPPKELYILRPDRMSVVPGTPEVPIAGYEYRAGSYVVTYPVQLWRNPKTGGMTPRGQICHSKYWNPTVEGADWYGLSPMRVAARNVDAFNSAVAWNVTLTQNTARPSGIFTTDDTTLDSTQAAQYTDVIRQRFSGAAGAGRPMVLGKGLKWQQLGLTPADMDWLNGLQWNSRQICAIFGIPPQLISDEEAKTYANYEEANRAVWNQKWLGMLDMVCGDLNTWLAPLFWEAYGEVVVISYDKDSIEAIQEDRQLKWKNAKDGTGFLKINEQRALLGYEPLSPEEGGETILVPTGMVPLHVSAGQEDMPGLAAINAKPDTTDPGAAGGLVPAQGSNPVPRKPGTKPKPRPKPKPKKKPGKKSDDGIMDGQFEDVDGDALLKMIAENRRTLALLSAGEPASTESPAPSPEEG
jgi:HK97 family phage portal protein